MSKTVMLVDDSPTVRQVMRFAFEHADYAVLEAADGLEALSALDGRKVSAVVCDIAMPKLDGLAFLKAMREKREYRFTPVVMLTTESQAEKKAQAQAAGAKAWVLKPFHPTQLLTVVQKLVLP